MARTIEVYPKVMLKGSTWHIIVKMRVIHTGQFQRVTRTFPAGVTGNEGTLKFVTTCIVPNSVTPIQLGGGLFDHTIGTAKYPGTFWDYWQGQAEERIEYGSGWDKLATSYLREGFATLVSQLGGALLAEHQHESDGTNTDWNNRHIVNEVVGVTEVVV